MTNQLHAVWCQPLAPPLKEVHLVPPGCWVEPHMWTTNETWQISCQEVQRVQKLCKHDVRKFIVCLGEKSRGGTKNVEVTPDQVYILGCLQKGPWFDGRKEGVFPRSFLSPLYNFETCPRRCWIRFREVFPALANGADVRLVVIKLAHVFNWTVFAGRLLDYTSTWMISWVAGKLQLGF